MTWGTALDSKRISGFESYEIFSDGRLFSHKTNRFMATRPTKAGYPLACLHAPGIDTSRYTHRLVAEAFLPNPHNHKCVNHKNGIKSDNRVENLEWCSYRENALHAYRTGLRAQPRGFNSRMTRMTRFKLLKIHIYFCRGYKSTEASRRFRLSTSLMFSLKEVYNYPAETTLILEFLMHTHYRNTRHVKRLQKHLSRQSGTPAS